PERHRREVGLGPFVDEVGQSRRQVDQDGQNTVGRRVERPAMAGLHDPGKPANRADDGKRRWTGWLIDVQDAGGHSMSFIRKRASVRTLASASFTGSASSIPASRRWPPPPNFSGISPPWTWSRLRRLTFA